MAEEPPHTVGIVLVSHSAALAEGLAELAGQMAGPGVDIIAAGGGPGGDLGTDEDRVRTAVRRADSGGGAVVLADLGSSVLTTRHILESAANGHVQLADAPFVEGAVAAAVASSAGAAIEAVLQAAEGARGVNKL
jgi:PTS hybrid protein